MMNAAPGDDYSSGGGSRSQGLGQLIYEIEEPDLGVVETTPGEGSSHVKYRVRVAVLVILVLTYLAGVYHTVEAVVGVDRCDVLHGAATFLLWLMRSASGSSGRALEW